MVIRSLSRLGRSSQWLTSTCRHSSKRFSSDSRNIFITSSQKSLKSKSIGSFERLVGHPSPLLGLSGTFVGSELKQLPTLVQKLLSSRHPVVAKSDQLLSSSYPSSSYSLGLLTLLVSKAMNGLNPTLPDMDQFGITSNQRAMAEVTEMINMGHMIHSEVVDIEEDSHHGDTTLIKDIEFGNKLLIIGGDLLLAGACKELALLYNPKVVGLISQAISDIMTGVCLKEVKTTTRFISSCHTFSDPVVHSLPDLSNPISSDPHITNSLYTSLYDSYFHISSLMSNSCRCCAIMAELDQLSESLAADIGRHLGIAQQAINDLVHMQKKKNPEDLLSIADVSIAKASHFLDLLPPSKSRDALTEIVSSLKTHIQDS